MDFPRTVDEITPEWLTSVLRVSGEIEGDTRVETIEVKSGAGDEQGVTSDVAKLAVRYNHDTAQLPNDLVAKFATTNSNMHQTIDQMGMYECEVRFYSELAPLVDLRTPHILFTEFDTQDRAMLIVLEDLSRFRSVGTSEDCSIEDARSALLSLAKVQAAWWNSPALDNYGWLLKPDVHQSLDELTTRLNGFTDKFVEVADEYIPAGIEEIARAMAPKMLDLAVIMLECQSTLSHGDYRTANMFFDDQPDGTSLPVVFDWQSASSFGFASDISHFLNSSFTAESRRKYESALVSEYHEVLLSGGVDDLSRADFEDQIRQALLFRMFHRIAGLAMGGQRMLESEAGRNNVIAMCDRMQMLIDWNCEEVIPK